MHDTKFSSNHFSRAKIGYVSKHKHKQFIAYSGSGYSSGAPYGTCLTMYPHHGISVHQPTPCPIKLHVDKATYRPNEELTVIVKSDDDVSFKGIEMRVHRVSGNTEEMMGEFTNYTSDKLQTQSCFFGKSVCTV
ncbi:hypothetical protein LOTGIDRAFT_172090 [Lottia gigantea]|uniref:Reelin domain-containing protein n=1 Tax=Lottia gigantea TaxID=225164 RepID=V4AXZ6_LOTGI|nr:hypothetical protein LOTGIDRAFT_172090 [Lottia gigantea]ESP02433.1 hypothetical protein LOTGIDRAFT_172090 [Lottia gigantea]